MQEGAAPQAMGSQQQRHKLSCPQRCTPRKPPGTPSIFVDCNKKFSFQKKQSHKESLIMSPFQCSTWDMKEFEGWGRRDRNFPYRVERTYCHEFSHQNMTMILIYSSAIFEGKDIDPNTNVSIVYKSRNSLWNTCW